MKMSMKVISSTIDEFLFHDFTAMPNKWSEACWICLPS